MSKPLFSLRPCVTCLKSSACEHMLMQTRVSRWTSRLWLFHFFKGRLASSRSYQHAKYTPQYSNSVLQTVSFSSSLREKSDSEGSSEIRTEDCMYTSHGASQCVHTESRPVVVAKQKQERYGWMLRWWIALVHLFGSICCNPVHIPHHPPTAPDTHPLCDNRTKKMYKIFVIIVAREREKTATPSALWPYRFHPTSVSTQAPKAFIADLFIYFGVCLYVYVCMCVWEGVGVGGWVRVLISATVTPSSVPISSVLGVCVCNQ